LHAVSLRVADLATVFEACCEGLFFAGEVVPVEAGWGGGDFGVDDFAEEVAVEEDVFVFLGL
jgi:hypothetical protein